MNKESNLYTFSFAIVMVLVIAVMLSVVSEVFMPFKDKNKSDKKRIDILSAIDIHVDRADAKASYEKYIISSTVINHQGDTISQACDKCSAFEIDVLSQYRNKNLSIKDRKYPLFHAKKGDSEYVIVPMVGSGLWGPIWGFVSFESDLETIYGAAFDHKTETPGLGAEINTDPFEKPFSGKRILNKDGEFVSVQVQKGGALDDDPHAVDGITGGTITSDGVADMLENTLSIYNKYFVSLKINEKDSILFEANNILKNNKD